MLSCGGLLTDREVLNGQSDSLDSSHSNTCITRRIFQLRPQRAGACQPADSDTTCGEFFGDELALAAAHGRR